MARFPLREADIRILVQNIIAGLALGMRSTGWPLLLLAGAIVGALLLGGGFLYYAIRMMRGEDEKVAMKTFGYSIWYLMALFALLLVDLYLPLIF